MDYTAFRETIIDWIELAALGLEALAVVLIVAGITIASLHYLYPRITRPEGRRYYREYKARIGKILLLGLEILVAADIVKTVALESTLQSVAILGLLVLIRTFLSWSLVVEIEGRWPWQPWSDIDTPAE
jgi:uncharacterized membrane protein